MRDIMDEFLKYNMKSCPKCVTSRLLKINYVCKKTQNLFSPQIYKIRYYIILMSFLIKYDRNICKVF